MLSRAFYRTGGALALAGCTEAQVGFQAVLLELMVGQDAYRTQINADSARSVEQKTLP